MFRRRGMLYLTGMLIVIAPPAAWLLSSLPATVTATALPAPTRVAQPARGVSLAAHAELVARDPMALVDLGHARFAKEISTYRCVLTKQERLGNELTKVQEVEVRVRNSPQAVYMLWRANADQAKRALYMDSSEFVDKHGRKVARVEPAGAIARLFVKDLFVPIDGPEARKASRRNIAECGFASTFDLFERYNRLATDAGVLKLRYAGTGTIDGRPTYIIVRDLPYRGPGGPYPDARLVMHLDQEWLLPVALYSYADHNETQLLGSYVFTQIELNPAFSEDTFKF